MAALEISSTMAGAAAQRSTGDQHVVPEQGITPATVSLIPSGPEDVVDQGRAVEHLPGLPRSLPRQRRVSSLFPLPY
jgi:hypothetical protein